MIRQGITTRYIGPSNYKPSRVKAVARKAGSWNKEMGLTVSYDSALSSASAHAKAARALAAKLEWDGLWVAGGKPEEDGFMYVNIGSNIPPDLAKLGRMDEDWFIITPESI